VAAREPYTIPDGAKTALAPYVAQQMKFFVAKSNIQKVLTIKRRRGPVRRCASLRFDELRLPVRLGLLNARQAGSDRLYPASEKRFEVGQLSNVFIPTNLEVSDEVRKITPPLPSCSTRPCARQRQSRVHRICVQTSSCDPCPTPPLQALIWSPGADVAAPKDQQMQAVRAAIRQLRQLGC